MIFVDGAHHVANHRNRETMRSSQVVAIIKRLNGASTIIDRSGRGNENHWRTADVCWALNLLMYLNATHMELGFRRIDNLKRESMTVKRGGLKRC